ncbi:MAG: MASE1 domain-containing protein [Rhodospirillales bacterium]
MNYIQSTDWRHVVLVGVVTGGLYYFGVLLALNFVNPVEKIAFFWPSNAIAAVVLLFAPRRNWLVILGAVVVGYLAARGPAGGLPPAVLAGFSVANLFECAVVALVLGAAWRGDVRLATMPRFLPYLLIACVIASTLSGVIGALVVSQILQGATFLRAFVVWFAGDLSGLVLVLPFVVAFLVPGDGARRLALPAGNLRGGIMVGLVLILAAAGTFLWLPEGWNPWLFMPYLILGALLWVAYRVNLIWTIIGAFCAGLVEIVATFIGFGLFRFEGMSITDEVVLMKAAIAVMTAGLLLFAASCAAAEEE